MLYQPSIELLEEILDEKTVYSGLTGFIIWNSIAVILAPGIMFLLLKNDNEKWIQEFALKLADKRLDDDE